MNIPTLTKNKQTNKQKTNRQTNKAGTKQNLNKEFSKIVQEPVKLNSFFLLLL